MLVRAGQLAEASFRLTALRRSRSRPCSPPASSPSARASSRCPRSGRSPSPARAARGPVDRRGRRAAHRAAAGRRGGAQRLQRRLQRARRRERPEPRAARRHPGLQPVPPRGAVRHLRRPAVGEVDCSVGGFPAEYGGRLSSVLDVDEAEERRGRARRGAGVSLLATSLVARAGARPARAHVVERRGAAHLRRALVGALSDRALPYHFQDAQAHVDAAGCAAAARWRSRRTRARRARRQLRAVRRLGARGRRRLRVHWGNALGGLTCRQPLRLRDAGRQRGVWCSARRTRASHHARPGRAARRASTTRHRGAARAARSAEPRGGRHTPRVGYEAGARRRWRTTRTQRVRPIATLFTLRQRPRCWRLYVDDAVARASAAAARARRCALEARGRRRRLERRVAARSVRWFVDAATSRSRSAGRPYTQWMHAVRNEDVPVRIFDFWVASDRVHPGHDVDAPGARRRALAGRAVLRVEARQGLRGRARAERRRRPGRARRRVPRGCAAARTAWTCCCGGWRAARSRLGRVRLRREHARPAGARRARRALFLRTGVSARTGTT